MTESIQDRTVHRRPGVGRKRGNLGSDEKRVRELVYTLATKGEIFNAHDILKWLKLPRKAMNSVARTLMSASAAGLIEQVGEENVKLELDPESWIEGASSRILRVKQYKGSARMRRDK